MFPKLPEDLSTLSDEDLAQLEAQLVTGFNEATAEGADIADDVVAELAGVADSVERLRSEQGARHEAATARAEQVAQLAGRVNASDTDEGDGEGDNGEGQGDEGSEGEADAPTETEQPTETETAEPAATEAIAAAAPKPTPKPTLAGMRSTAPARTKPRPEAPRQFATIIASADVPGITPGAQVNDLQHVAELLTERHRTLGYGNGDNVAVVRMTREFPNERRLGGDMSAADFSRRLDSFDTTPNAIMAAGGLCAPVSPYYDQQVIADAARPVRDALANFQADRGGIRYNPPPKLSSISSGIARVTAAQDASNTTKSCFTVTCASSVEVDVAAVYSCLTFGNFGARAWPESVEAWTKLALAQQARIAETALLDGIASASTSVTAAGLVGAGRELFARLGQGAAGYRSRNRMRPDAPLTVMLPAWTLDLVHADFARTFTDESGLISMSNADVEKLFGVRNLNPVWYLDSKTGGGQVFGSAAGGQTYSDGTTTGTTNWSSATATFTSADVGKAITGTNIAAGTTIASVTNGTTIVLSQNVTGTTGSGSLSFNVGRSVLAQFPTQVYAYLFPTGSFLHLDAGTLDIGLVRDSVLNSTNQFSMFTELFENVAFVGVESNEIVLNLSPNGSYAAAKAITDPINS